MSKNQITAEELASLLHSIEADVEKTTRHLREVRKSLKALHKTLEQAATEHAATLGIDVTPLSAGGEK